MATPSTELLRLDEEISARLKEEQRRASRRLLWQERLTSLWTPLLAFGLAFIPYVALIEYHREAAGWAQPLLKDLGLLMVAWFGGLLMLRWLAPRLARRLELRRSARELEREIHELLAQRGSLLEPKVREELVAQTVEVRAASIAGDPEALEKQLGKLSALVERHLSKWRRQSVSDFVLGFAKALAVALLIRTVAVEPFKIPSGSMLPTLNIGDQVFVNKFIYGVRIPWVNKVPFVIVRPPQRGDVIVFNNPVNESLDYIKRVVGVPGDRIEIVDEQVYVNGKLQPRRKVSDDFIVWNQDQLTGEWSEEKVALYEEMLGGVSHAALQRADHPKGHLTEGPYVVPEGHVFVMGDNRDNSSDSRYGLGSSVPHVEYVPYGHIKGKAMVIWLSLSHDGLLGRLFGGTGLRADRFFLPVR